MAVKKIGQKYRCSVCGNEVIVTKVGGGELVCCGKPMEDKTAENKSGFFSNLIDKLDKKMEEKAKAGSCGCKSENGGENKSCCG